MNVSLTPRLEAMIREKVESGMYNNASEVVREALRLLDQHDRERRLRDELAIGAAQIERGKTVRWTPQLLEQLKRESETAAAEGRPISDEVIP
jgi:antitoxin ParD1/3/4